MLDAGAQTEGISGMPPRCVSLDEPVVTAARVALEEDDFEWVAPYVAADDEFELRDAFDLAVKAWTQGLEARVVAERYFTEMTVRLNRAGEVTSFTGLKPAGSDVGPVVDLVEKAISDGSPHDLLELLSAELRSYVTERVRQVVDRQGAATRNVEEARVYVRMSLGLRRWANEIYQQLRSGTGSSRSK